MYFEIDDPEFTQLDLITLYEPQIRSKRPFIYKIDKEKSSDFLLVKIAQYRSVAEPALIGQARKALDWGIVRCQRLYSAETVGKRGYLEGSTLEKGKSIFRRDEIVPRGKLHSRCPRTNPDGFLLVNEDGRPIFRYIYLGIEDNEGEYDFLLDYQTSEMSLEGYRTKLEEFERTDKVT